MVSQPREPEGLPPILAKLLGALQPTPRADISCRPLDQPDTPAAKPSNLPVPEGRGRDAEASVSGARPHPSPENDLISAKPILPRSQTVADSDRGMLGPSLAGPGRRRTTPEEPQSLIVPAARQVRTTGPERGAGNLEPASTKEGDVPMASEVGRAGESGVGHRHVQAGAHGSGELPRPTTSTELPSSRSPQAESEVRTTKDLTGEIDRHLEAMRGLLSEEQGAEGVGTPPEALRPKGEKAEEDATNQDHAEQFFAAPEAEQREKILGSPIEIHQARDSQQRENMLAQLELLSADRSEDPKDRESVTQALVEIFVVEEGDRTNTKAGSPAWLAEMQVKLVREVIDERIEGIVLHALQERLPRELAEPVGEMLPVVSAISLSPLDVLLAVNVYGTMLVRQPGFVM